MKKGSLILKEAENENQVPAGLKYSILPMKRWGENKTKQNEQKFVQ